MKDLDLTTLRLFVEVCDAKSIKRVAERAKLRAKIKRISKRAPHRIGRQIQARREARPRARAGQTLIPDAIRRCDQRLGRG